jgi:multiple sugar transport system substrate-binding protein
MSKISYTRRQVCQIGLSSLAGLSLLDLAACGGSAPSTSTSTNAETLQLSFWGDASRNKLTKNAITLYQQAHPNVKINSWFATFSTYFDKLNTQIAGGSIPDLIQMDMAYLAQYVKQNQLLDLTSSISDKTIDLSDFDKDLLANSEDNKVPYGIPLGGNYECLVYDTDLVKAAGLQLPPESWTWTDFADYTNKISKAFAGKNIYGTTDASGAMDLFEIWVRQRGKELYTTDGKLALTVDDIASWFSYWSDLRKSGACAPAQVQATVAATSGPAASLLGQGKVVFNNAHSNQFHGYQVLSKHKFALQSVPTGGSGPGNYLKPSMLMSVAAKSKYTKEAASFINFLITEPSGVKAIGLDRGVPGSTRAREALQPTLKDEDKIVLAYQSLVSSNSQSRPKTVLDPAGAGKIQTALGKVSQSVAFGKQSANDGANSLYQQALAALA